MTEVLLNIQIDELPEGIVLVTSKDLPGLVVQANSMAEALDMAQDAAQKLVESYRERRDPLPRALRKKLRGSGPFAVKLRIPASAMNVYPLRDVPEGDAMPMSGDAPISPL